MERPSVWLMIKEAVDHIGGEVSYKEIREYIAKKWDNVNTGTIDDQIQVLSVNHRSRIHYNENYKPRLTNSGSPYDYLFSTGRGLVIKYNVAGHGVWEIHENNLGKLEVRLTGRNADTNAFLFVWNPKKWEWTDLEQCIEQLEITGVVSQRWSCISHKKVKPGDRAFLARVGIDPKGIFASGIITSEPFLSQHWSGEDKDIYRVLIDFDVLLNPEKEPILSLDLLEVGNLGKQQWTPQSSGISIKPEILDELEAVWFDFLATQNIRSNPYGPSGENAAKTFTEGAANQVIQTRYERNAYARSACIKHYGYTCSVCDLDFEKRYGEIGKKFIHVHHLTQISADGKSHIVDPIKDLRPVCPNCHAMLHKQNPSLEIEALKRLLK